MQRCRASFWTLIFLLPAAASTVRFTTTVLDGANATLNCSGCSGAWTFSRTHSSNAYLPATSTGDYEIINATYAANDGFYICGGNQCVYRVNVLGPPMKNGSTEITHWCSPIASICDAGMFNQCGVIGNPEPNVVYWSRHKCNGVLTRECSDLPETIYLYSAESILQDAKNALYCLCSQQDLLVGPPLVGAIHSVAYNCTASNSQGNITVPVTLYLDYSPDIGSFYSDCLPPSVTVTEGENTTLRVCIDGPYFTKFQWRKNGINIEEYNETRFTVVSMLVNKNTSKLESTLQINSVSKNDEGNYSCEASFKKHKVTSTQLIVKRRPFPLWAILIICSGALIIMIIIIFALVLAARLKKKKKRNAIQRCFIWDYYVSFTLSSKSSARQLSSNCHSFFKDVLRPALTKTGSSYYNLHVPSDSQSGPRLGDDPMVASHQAIEKSWKMIIVIDEEEDEAGFEEQRAEVADYQTDIAALEDEKEKIHPSFVIVRLGSRSTATDVGVDDPMSAIVIKEETVTDFKKRSELRNALMEAKQNSEFIWDVALFYIDSDSDFAHKVRDVIQTRLGCLVQSFCHRNPDLCHLSTRRVAAYSRSVVAIISDDYVEHAWEQDKWIVQSERKAYLPIIESHRITCPLPAEISQITYVRKDEDDFDSKLIRGLSEIKAT